MVEYEESKDELANLRRRNLVLWKHIKKMRKRNKKASKMRREKSPDEGEGGEHEDPELDRLLEDELQQLTQDPRLISDLQRLRRETRTVGTDAQDDLFVESQNDSEILNQSSLSEKVEDIIDQQTKSIVDVITNTQLQNYYRAFKQ